MGTGVANYASKPPAKPGIKVKNKTKQQLLNELKNTHQRIYELEDLAAKHFKLQNGFKESEERYRHLTEATTSIIWSADGSGGFVIPQPSWEKYTGQPWSEHKRFGWVKKIHPDDIERLLAAWKKACEEITLFETWGRVWNTGFNNWRDCEVRAVPIINPDGSLREWTGIILDITERRQAEKSVAESENLLRLITDNIPALVAFVSRNKEHLFANRKYCEIFATSPEKIIGKKVQDIMGESVYKHISPHIDSVLSGQTVEFDISIIQADGTPRDLSNIYVPHIKDQTVDGFFALVLDTTEQKQIAEQLRQSQKMEAIGTLSGGIAHDFNNLLTPILGYAQLAKMNLEPYSNEVECLKNIEKSATRAKGLVEKILLISKSSLAHTETVQLKNLAEEVLTILRASIPKNINIRQEIDFDLPHIAADPSQIYQVILNLCTNAAQSMQIDGGDLWVRLNHVKHHHFAQNHEQQKEDEFICLSVQDNGCGMTAATLGRIYEPFFTTREKGARRGTGLGLSIVSSVIKQHKGHLEVESSVGAGTIFRVYFPVLTLVETSHPNEHPPAIVSGNEHVLLVDDDAIVNQLGTTFLEKLGYQVTSFTDSNEALRAFSADPQSFQLIITDHTMPSLDGPQLMEKIKAIRPDIPMLLITGYSNLATSENLQQWGCDGIVTKPYDLKNLSQVINLALARGELSD